MTGQLIFLEDAHDARRRQCSHSGSGQHNEGTAQREGHCSVRQFEQSTREEHETTRLLGEFQNYPGGDALHFLRTLNEVRHCNASLILSAMSAATAIAALIVNQSQILLRHGYSLLPTDHTVGDSDAKKFAHEAENVRSR